MADDTESLLAQAQAIQAQKMGQAEHNDLLKQAQAIQQSKLSQSKDQGPQDYSMLDSAGIAAQKGLTGGLTGVAAGAGAALGDYSVNQDWSKAKDAYKEGLEEQKHKEDTAHKAHPIVSNIAEIGSSIPTMAVGGGLLKSAGIASPVAQGAILGGGSGVTNYLGKNADPTASGLAVAGGLGAGLGAAGGKIGSVIGNKLNPESLEVAGSKMASTAAGLKPTKELATEFNKETGKIIQGSDIIKGIGKTAMDEGALPLTGGPKAMYDKSIDAIDNNYQRLAPILQNTQNKITPDTLEASGNIGDKTADFLYKFRDSLNTDPDQDAIMQKIEQKYIPYIEKLSKVDGNLNQLNAYKKGLQEKAIDLAAAAYDKPASDLKPEADFVKRLGGIVRQHIEDLSNSADPGAGDQISQINKTLSNLYTYKDAAKKLMNKGSGTLLDKTVDIVPKILTGNTLGGLGKIVSAKGLNTASNFLNKEVPTLSSPDLPNFNPFDTKIVKTPIGNIVQKAAQPVAQTTANEMNNPWSQNVTKKTVGFAAKQAFGSTARADDYYQPLANRASQATINASNLYNATDDSLKQVASNLKSVPGLEFYADHLNKAIDTDDEGEKNRAIFLIMQNPKSRKLISGK